MRSTSTCTGLRVELGGLFFLLATFLAPGSAHGQTLLAEPDTWAVPFGAALVVDVPGVLDNDTLDGEAAAENGATAELVVDASHGSLVLNADGSFSYTPGPGFHGTDTFVYRAVVGAISDEATVTLTACAGGPEIFTCWEEDAFLEKAVALGLPRFREGFENDAIWGLARSPDTQPGVSSRGFTWQSNHPDPPASNAITTGSGPARTGQWGVFDPEHGFATGTPAVCDVDTPPAECFFHDGFTIVREPGSPPLHGAGGYFTTVSRGNVAIVLDGDSMNPRGGGQIFTGYQFFGVVDARPNGSTQIQFREVDGKIGDTFFIFGDDFTLLARPKVKVPGLAVPGLTFLVLVLALAASRALRRAGSRD